MRDVLLMKSFVWLIFLFRIRSLYFMRDPVRELVNWTRDEPGPLPARRGLPDCPIWLLPNVRSIYCRPEKIPKVFWEFTTSRILTMEFLAGPSVSAYVRMVENNEYEALAKLKQDGFDPAIFCGNVITNFLRDAFRFGVFHAGSSSRKPSQSCRTTSWDMSFRDFGIVAKLTPEAPAQADRSSRWLYQAATPDAIYREFLNICMLTPDADLEGMRRYIAKMSRLWYEEPAVHGKVRFRVSVTVAMMDLLTVCRNYGVLVDREMIKYIRSTVLVDGVVARLAPQLDLAQALRVVVEDYLFEQSRKKLLSGSRRALATHGHGDLDEDRGLRRWSETHWSSSSGSRSI